MGDGRFFEAEVECNQLLQLQKVTPSLKPLLEVVSVPFVCEL